MATASSCLVLRLAGPLQSWGDQSEFNHRETRSEPTKSGVVGLLAAAEGRRREDSIVDLVGLRLGVRVDQPGTLLRDYHTVSDLRGVPLLSASVNKKGIQRSTAPAKHTAVTHRFYLQDAVFVVVVEGPPPLLEGLANAIRSPRFPLALGRRSCVPTQPILVPGVSGGALWEGDVDAVLREVPWQASAVRVDRYRRQVERQTGSLVGVGDVDLSVTVDDPAGTESSRDVPVTFAPKERAFTTRRVRRGWVSVPTGIVADGVAAVEPHRVVHDPLALLGW